LKKSQGAKAIVFNGIACVRMLHVHYTVAMQAKPFNHVH